MKIIKEGSLEYGKKWWHGKQAECHGCGRVMEMEAGDINIDSFNESDFEISFKCPICVSMVFRIRGYDYKKSTFKREFTE